MPIGRQSPPTGANQAEMPAWAARLGRARPHVLAAVVAVGAAVLMTWPLATQAGLVVLRAIYFWDAYANTMIMGSRVDAALGLGPLSLYDAYYFAPLERAIVYNENHFGLSLLFAPFYLLQGPIWGYNLTLLTSLGLSVFFTYLLVRRLTGSAAAGIVSGVAFAFCPYVAFELGRIQLVATQWIPACFLFLHRAIEGQKRRDVALFWAAYLLQIGTCLYYAMFLMPLLGLLGWFLLVRSRPPLRFYLWFGGVALGAGLIALCMVYPYFAARSSFELERSLAFASSYDGKLGFFTNVHQLNRTWTSLHHETEIPGAPEEIAFPGLTVVVLCLVLLAVALGRVLHRFDWPYIFRELAFWLVLLCAVGATVLLAHSFLAGLCILVPGVLIWRGRGGGQPFTGAAGVYLAAFLVALLLFLGIEPLEFRGAPVRGLYYYLYTYFPGFSGIRKVSRQAIMTTFLLTVLAGFGSAWLLSKLRGPWSRRALTLLLLAAVVFELRCFPYPVEPVWGAAEVPKMLRFVRSLPERDLVAAIPQSNGRRLLRWDAGMAFHDYQAVLHKHRFVNGQSSWQPPVTELARRALDRLPDDGARRALLSIGTRHLLVYGEELGRDKEDLVSSLLARPDEYRLAFRDGPQSVISLLGGEDPSLALLDVPPLPEGVRLIATPEVRVRAAAGRERVGLAVDGREDTHWSSGRFQERGQFFDIGLATPHRVRALEIRVPGRVMDAPVSYQLRAARGGEDLGVVLAQPELRLYREQIFSPKTFVWRVVLPEAVLADRLRITIEQPMPGHYFSIHELSVYEE